MTKMATETDITIERGKAFLRGMDTAFNEIKQFTYQRISELERTPPTRDLLPPNEIGVTPTCDCADSRYELDAFFDQIVFHCTGCGAEWHRLTVRINRPVSEQVSP